MTFRESRLIGYNNRASGGVGSTVEVGEIESLAKGSLIVGDGTGAPTTKTAGANGTFLTFQSGQADGLQYVAAASASEITTGTDTAKPVVPDTLAGSSIFGVKVVQIEVFGPTTAVATGDGKAYFAIPAALNGMNLIRAQAHVVTAGTTNATTVMVHNLTDAADMLSGAISIASAGVSGTVGTINTSTDDVVTNDRLRIDVDSVSSTPPQGLIVVLEFQLP